MKTLTHLLLASSLVVAVACGDDDAADDDAPTVDAGVTPDAPSGPDAGSPVAPTLGAQIDRAGRPAITTALIDPFDLSGDMDNKRNMYNQDSSVATWAATWTADIVGSMAVLDGLNPADDKVEFDACGDQILYSDTTGYQTLGGVLALDVLTVNAGSTGCDGTYLAVEANATGILLNQDCGGRVPAADVVDTSYSVLAGLTFLPPAVGDGVPANDQQLPAGFPYLAAAP